MSIKRKNIRLDMSLYKEQDVFYITICTHKKRKYFHDRNLVQCIRDMIHKLPGKFNVDILIYMVMPDHIHLLVSNKGNDSVIRLVKYFKQITGYYYRKNTNTSLWQKSFYDHILRQEEDIEDIMLYIANNPVRKGLAKNWKDYPFIGSTVFDLNGLLE